MGTGAGFLLKAHRNGLTGQEPFCRAKGTWNTQTLPPGDPNSSTTSSRSRKARAKHCTQVSCPIPKVHRKNAQKRNLTKNQKARSVRHIEARPHPPRTHTNAHKEESRRSRKASLSYLLSFQFLDSPVALLLLLFLLYQHRVSHEP